MTIPDLSDLVKIIESRLTFIQPDFPFGKCRANEGQKLIQWNMMEISLPMKKQLEMNTLR